MLKVKNTQAPTVRQLCNIATNLRKHFNTYVSVEIEVDYYSHTDLLEVKYSIYLASNDKAPHMLDSWQELLAYYHKLMR